MYAVLWHGARNVPAGGEAGRQACAIKYHRNVIKCMWRSKMKKEWPFAEVCKGNGRVRRRTHCEMKPMRRQKCEGDR